MDNEVEFINRSICENLIIVPRNLDIFNIFIS